MNSADTARSIAWSRFYPAAVFAIAIAVYANAVPNGFVDDDIPQIVENPLAQGIANFFDSFLRKIAMPSLRFYGEFRPAAWFTFAAQASLHGFDPYLFHAGNVLIHAVNSVLLYFLALAVFRKTGRDNNGPAEIGALFAGLVFAVHPIHTEAVDWIMSRSELLMTSFAIGALILHARAGGNRISAPLAGLFCFLAMLSKENGIAVPAIALAMDYAFPAGAGRTGISGLFGTVSANRAKYVAYAAAVAAYLGMRLWFSGEVALSSGGMAYMNPLFIMPWFERIVNAVMLAGFYIAILLFPFRLSMDYSYGSIPMAESPMDYRVLLAFAAIILIAWLVYRKRNSGPAVFAASFFVVSFLPVSNLIVPIGIMLAERTLYLPSAAFCILLGAGAMGAGALPRIGRGLLIPLLVIYSAGTIDRNFDWKDQISIYESSLANVPGSVRIRVGLCYLYGRQGRFDLSVPNCKYALAQAPDYPPLLNIFAWQFIYQNDYESARAVILHALKIVPDSGKYTCMLAFAEMKLGRMESAGRLFAEAVRLDPDKPWIHNWYGNYLAASGKYPEAIAQYEAALAILPGMEKAKANLDRARRLMAGESATPASRSDGSGAAGKAAVADDSIDAGIGDYAVE